MSKKTTEIMTYGKVPPQAKELEEAVLGAIMIDKRAFDTVAEILKSESFYVDAHQMIFEAMQALVAKSAPIDLLTVIEQLKSMESLDVVGGMFYVTKLTNVDPRIIVNVESHCRMILEKFIQRELIRVSSEIISEAYKDSTDSFTLLDKAESSILQIANANLNNNYSSLDIELVKSMKRIEDRKNAGKHITGITSGYDSVDSFTHGWQPTDMIVLAARPSVGKTVFALNIARNACMAQTPVNVGFFSLEMSTGQLVERLISAESEVPLDNIKSGILDSERLNRIYSKAIGPLGKAKMFIDDTAALNIFQLRSKVKRMVNKDKVKLIIIDYLQLMSGDGSNKGNREQEISKISREIKKLAKEMVVPIIALSQLSRETEKRADQTPQLSDLRESGAIEQDADMVMFLYGASKAAIEQYADLANVRYLKGAKHRNGSLFDIELKANNLIQKWTELRTEVSNWKPINTEGV